MLNSVVQLTCDLVKIPSISPLDLGCQDILINRLKKLNFNIEKINFFNTSNFFAWKGEGKTVLFSGHTDVVLPGGNKKDWYFDPFLPKIKNNKLFGRGVVDMKGSLAAMIVAVENFIKRFPNYSGKIAFLITSDEESSGKYGIKKVVKILKNRKEYFDYCIIGEPTSEFSVGDCIKNGRRGSISATLKIFGVQGHIAYPNFSINPIHISLLFLQKLKNISWNIFNVNFCDTSLQIYKITTPSYCENIIPQCIEIGFNIRFTSDISVNNIKEIIKKLLNQHKLKYSIIWKVRALPYLSSAKFLLKKISSIIFKETGFYPVVKTSGGTSDGRYIHDISSELIEFGLLGSTMHKVNECSSVSDLDFLRKIYELILLDLLIT